MKKNIDSVEGDLGFSFCMHKSGELMLSHHGRQVTRFNAQRGDAIYTKLQNASFIEQQKLMARLTGNYKRGNESASKRK